MEGLVPSFCFSSLAGVLTLGHEFRVQDAFLDFTTYNFKVAFTQNFTDGNFTYNPDDVIQSSVAGWLDYGYKYAHPLNAGI